MYTSLWANYLQFELFCKMNYIYTYMYWILKNCWSTEPHTM